MMRHAEIVISEAAGAIWNPTTFSANKRIVQRTVFVI